MIKQTVEVPRNISRFWRIQLGVLAFTIAVFCSLLFGNMVSSGIHSVYDKEHWLYINRGLPVAWNGISLASKKVELPFVVLPYLSRELVTDHSEWVKVLDLRIFVPLFLFIWLMTYWILSCAAQRLQYTRRQKLFLILFHSLLILSCVKLYFSWFPNM